MTTSRPSSTISWPEPVRRGLLDGLWTVLRLSGWSTLRGRRGGLLLAVGCLPLIPVAASWFRSGVSIQGALGFAKTMSESYFRLINLIVFLFLGCAALGEEIEARTLPYLLTRAVPRSSLLLGRYLAAAWSAFALLGVCALIAYLLTVTPMGVEALWVDLPYLLAVLAGLLLAALAYCAVCMLLTMLVRRPLLVGLVLTFLWEQWAATSRPPICHYTILHHIYVLLYGWTELEVFRELSQWARYSGTAGIQSQAWSSLGFIVLAALLVAIWRFQRREVLG